MSNCPTIKSKIASNDVINDKSYSNNSEAIKYYNLGIDEEKKGNYEKALNNFKKAIS